MTAQPQPSMTEAEYLDYERRSPLKHDFWQGQVFAMAGASAAHNLIAANLITLLRTHVRGRGGRVFPSDMRLKVLKTGLYTYPDITIVCGPPQFAQDGAGDTLINPMIVIEILSPSTEAYDRGLKFQNYRLIDTLQEYVLVAQDTYRVEHYLREQEQRWVLTEATGATARCVLPALQCDLALSALYEDVAVVDTFPTSPPDTNMAQ